MTANKKSIAFKLTTFIVSMVVLQALLMTGILMLGGVLKQARENAYKSFSNVVSSRKNFLEMEMRNRWTNLDPFIAQISSRIDLGEMDSDTALRNVSEDLISMLRTTKATGAYVILRNENGSDKHSALYLRDYDPLMNSYSNNDLYMIMGPSDIGRDLKIPLDQTWKYQFEMTPENQDFYSKPYNNSSLTTNSKLIGYWTKPFRIVKDDLTVITYSMPLLDEEKTVIGVIGIELTLNYLTQFLPATDLQAKDSLGYMIVYGDSDDSALMPIISAGALQKRMIDTESPLDMNLVSDPYQMYEVNSKLSNETIYASMDQLNLYAYNTPFESESWHLVGMMREDHLLSYVGKIQNIMWGTFGIAVVLGILGGVFFSYRFTKPIVGLSREVRQMDSDSKIVVSETGILEVDELATAMVLANNTMLDSATRLSRIIDLFEVPIGAFEIRFESDLVFVTSSLPGILGLDPNSSAYLEKNEFSNRLDSIMKVSEPGESGVYRVSSTPEKWVKIRVTRSDVSVIGVVMDVTEDILDKMAIKKDRDLDPLTKLLNRKAFQFYYEKWHAGKTTDEVAAMVMFDLDNLKSINDVYGHKCGDTYILEAVDRLKQLGNETDLLLGRRSGDEFVALLHGFQNKNELVDRVNRLYEIIDKSPIELPDGSTKTVTMSGGLCWIDQLDFKYDDYLQYADDALYHVKRNDKGSWIEADV